MTTVDEIIPVIPNNIGATAGHFEQLSADLGDQAKSTGSLPELTPTWEGNSDRSFEDAARLLAQHMDATSDMFLEAATLLHTAEEIFTEYRDTAARLIADLQTFKDDPDRLAEVRAELAQLKTAGENVAERLATELVGILDGYAETATATGGPESSEAPLKPVALTREQNLRLYALLQGEGAMNYNEVVQGSHGNCYFLANIVALMSSDQGANFLRESIRPITSPLDGEIIGWEVRFFEEDDWWNPFDSRPETWQVVTERYKGGAHGNSQDESIAWLLERAYGQMIGHDDSNRGYIMVAAEELVGNGATQISGQGGMPWWAILDSGTYSASEQEEIIAALEDQRPVTTETATSPKDQDHWVREGTAEHGAYKSTAPVNLDSKHGEEVDIRIYGAHAYAIVEADQDGVTLVNPHGNNPIEGQDAKSDTGQFYMSWEEFEKRFGYVSVGGEYR